MHVEGVRVKGRVSGEGMVCIRDECEGEGKGREGCVGGRDGMHRGILG